VKRERPLTVKSHTISATETAGKLSAAANLNAKSGVSAAASIEGSTGKATKETVTTTSEGGAITWAQSRRADGQYRWELAPKTARHLLGKVWDAVTEPILAIKSVGETKIDPVARVEIRCRREDLLIVGLEAKNETALQKLVSGTIFDNKLAAAEAFIVNSLASRNLDVRNFDDPFGEILLADMLVNFGE
jgi:hypothetical protein